MPLRDHFHAPLDNRLSWQEFHGCWPTKIVEWLCTRLPEPYAAAPSIKLGSEMEIDIAAFEMDDSASWQEAPNREGGLATTVMAPSKPTLELDTDLENTDEYEVRVYDTRRGRRLVAAIEIVSPANKDRPAHRRAFVAKCAALLRQDVSVTIVDFVTSKPANLYRDLLADIHGPQQPGTGPSLYAVALRTLSLGHRFRLQAWERELKLGEPLPPLPLWLSETEVLTLELEPSYEDACRILRIPKAQP